MSVKIKVLESYVSSFNKACGTNVTSILQNKPPNFKVLNPADLKMAPKLQGDITQLSKFKNSDGVKALIKRVLGEDKSIRRSFDLTSFTGLAGLFKKSIKQYSAIDLNKSNRMNTYISDYVTCYFNKDKKLEKFFTYDLRNKDVRVFDKNGNILKHYSPEETHALLTYSHNSRNIHKLLRYNKKCKNEDEVGKSIDNLSNIFNFNCKVSKTSEDIIAYRALDRYSLDKIMSMPENGMIFEDPSFVSVATKKRNVFQFLNSRNFNHIMQIKIPKDSKYINMDEFGNIVVLNSPENELLLNKGSKFLIKNKGINGMIEAEYIGT